ncbi:MAG: hypothetical protein IT514_04075 [Burkholderiales bacterium]|nr:hypothetical protein [Burkholderiales bacterium]
MREPRLAFIHAAAAWFIILGLAFVNGALRQIWLVPSLGPACGTALSGLLLIVAVACVSWVLVRWRRPNGPACAWRVGAGWLAATLAFESGFGRLVQGRPWPEILSSYAFKDGNLWPLVLLAVLVSPYVLSQRKT